MSTTPINHVNEQLEKRKSLFKFLDSADIQEKLNEMNLNWETGEINNDSEASSIFYKEGYVTDDNKISKMGLLLLSRLCIDFSTLFKSGYEIEEKYIVDTPIRIGKNSATFKAIHKLLSRKVVLKFIRPGASHNINQALKAISNAELSENIIQPIDFFETEITDIYYNKLIIQCIVFPYVEGETFRNFLNNHKIPISSHTVFSFISQVGDALYQLEKNDAYHGDLHDSNIIVNYSSNSSLNFKIIDVSYGTMGSLSNEECHDNDLKYFKNHLWKILSIQQSYLPNMSIRKYLGSKAFNVVSTVMSNDTTDFSKVVSCVSNNTEYVNYAENKKKFFESKFSPPSLFKLQRYEEITDSEVALKLFVPFPELMNKVSVFANVFISGNRGSGKSTYLAAHSFSPKANESIMPFREIFGVYFPCRMGEFRLLSSEMHENTITNFQHLKQIIIIKIVRRTLEILAEAVDRSKLSNPVDCMKLKTSLKKITGGHDFVSLDSSIVSEIRNFSTSLVRIEMKVIDNLFVNFNGSYELNDIKEKDLVEFFDSVRVTFHELANTQFHLLFDDAGLPHVPIEVQKVINDLIIGSNPIYCIKISAEKLTYSFVTTTGKNIENGHDYFEYDISSILFIGAKNTGLNRSELEKYFRQIVKKRLSYFDYKSDDIVNYLGDNIIKNEQLINSLSTGKRNAYYCGWSLVWIIADRTPRNLIEIVAEIFSAANVDKTTTPVQIHNRTQDRAIRIISEKRLQSLNHISGTVRIRGAEVSLGKKLFEITTTIGSTFRIYLKNERGKKRKRQTLAIERNDTIDLVSGADDLLKKLITYGVLDSAKLDFARDDRVKKPIYVLNRIYCPAFGISPQRDNHLRLSKNKFELLLLNPNIFLVDGTRKLRKENDPNPAIRDLFGGIDGN